MVDIILSAVILVLSCLLVWREKQSRDERATLINAILAKSAREFKELESEPVAQDFPSEVTPDFTPIEEINHDQWEKAVTNV